MREWRIGKHLGNIMQESSARNTSSSANHKAQAMGEGGGIGRLLSHAFARVAAKFDKESEGSILQAWVSRLSVRQSVYIGES